jgi:hypothetical protein
MTVLSIRTLWLKFINKGAVQLNSSIIYHKGKYLQ